MKKFFLTLDLEEWWHLEYLKQANGGTAHKQTYVDKTFSFFEEMKLQNIKLTVFVVGEIAQQYHSLIRFISEQGHEVACHSYSHDLVYSLSDRQFYEDTCRAKDVLENIVNEPVLGYRAPCFSMDNYKLEILWNCGFKYDASLIRFKEHKLYNVLDMSGFQMVEDLVYEQNGYYEFETPTLDIASKSIPISGGGYFRLFPLWLMNKLMHQYLMKSENFVLYIHPFELSSDELRDAHFGNIINKLRFQIGRRHNVVKLYRFISHMATRGFEFLNFQDYLRARGAL